MSVVWAIVSECLPFYNKGSLRIHRPMEITDENPNENPHEHLEYLDSQKRRYPTKAQ